VLNLICYSSFHLKSIKIINIFNYTKTPNSTSQGELSTCVSNISFFIVYFAAAHPFHMQARCYVLSAILPLSCPLFPQAAYGVVFTCADVMFCLFTCIFSHYFHFQANHDIHVSIIQDILISFISANCLKGT
jgi:hypothetical protein